jgi:AcrR family transcriptional regulator
MNLRKEKAARLKLVILEHTVKLIGTRPFADLHVDEICRKCKISKVTLFKYFPQKEDIVLYYFRVWCLRRSVELQEKTREGMAGVYYLFDKLSEDYERNPGIILTLVGYLADMNRSPKPFPLKPEEKNFLFPDFKNIQQTEIQSLDQMMEKFVLEAIFKKEITRTTSTRDISNQLLSIFYGSIITTHINQISPAKNFFRKNIDLLLKGLN